MFGVKVLPIRADLLDADAPSRLFEKALEELGIIDVIVNNASII